MAADSSFYIADHSPNFPNDRAGMGNANWWVASVGLKDDKLWVAFRNGDTALYTLPLLTSQIHLANLKYTTHPGLYVNKSLKAAGIPYIKIANPTQEILSNTPISLGTSCETAPTIALNTRYRFIPILPGGWLRAFCPLEPNFTASWNDPNSPPQPANFWTATLDNSCAGRALVGSSLSEFTGPNAGLLCEVMIQYVGGAINLEVTDFVVV